MMYFSSNESLVSFLSRQVDNPNKINGQNEPLSLFVQLFSYSIPDPDFAKLGCNRPIFDTQTKLESLNTHVLFERVQRNCAACSPSVVERISEYACAMMRKVQTKLQTSSRDQLGDITSSEQNLEYALRALVNISLSYRWCTENGVVAPVYTSAQPCVSCQLNSVTMKFIQKLLPLKELMPKLRWLGKCHARLSLLISDLGQHPCHCPCKSGTPVGNEVLKNVKKIISAPFLNLAGTPMMAAVVRRVSHIQITPVSSPIGSPKVGSPKNPTPRLPSLDIGDSHMAFKDSSHTPIWKQRSDKLPSDQSAGSQGTPREAERWSLKWVSPPQTEPPSHSASAPPAPEPTCCQNILSALRSWQDGRDGDK